MTIQSAERKTSSSLSRRKFVVQSVVVCLPCQNRNLFLISLTHQFQTSEKFHIATQKVSILLERQKEKILADCRAEIRKHEFQADYDRKSIQKLTQVIKCRGGETNRVHQEDEQHRRDQQLFMNNYWNKIGIFVKVTEMEELKRFQQSKIDTFLMRKSIEDRDTILELTGKIQELQNEINCRNDSKDFQDAEPARNGQSHVASQPVSSPPHPNLGGMLSRS